MRRCNTRTTWRRHVQSRPTAAGRSNPSWTSPSRSSPQRSNGTATYAAAAFPTPRSGPGSQVKRHQPNLLLAQVAKRGMPGSQENQSHAVAGWLLDMIDAGVDVTTMRRMSALTDRGIKQCLKRALDAASGNSPNDLIIRKPDGTPAHVSWLTPNGRLMHRAIDGAFPARYPQENAIEPRHFVFQQLVEDPDRHARRRALTMLTMAEDGIHTFGCDAGRKVNRMLTQSGMDEDAKRTFIQKLHDDEDVVKLLLQRCGVGLTWIASKHSRTLSRQSRAHRYSPAITRRLVEITGHNPDTYCMTGAEHRIPEPAPEAREECIQGLLGVGLPQRGRSGIGDPRRAARRTPPAEA